jgi:hypothetical protein
MKRLQKGLIVAAALCSLLYRGALLLWREPHADHLSDHLDRGFIGDLDGASVWWSSHGTADQAWFAF